MVDLTVLLGFLQSHLTRQGLQHSSKMCYVTANSDLGLCRIPCCMVLHRSYGFC